MKNGIFRSVALKLSLLFSLILTTAVLLLSIFFTLALRHFVREKQSADLKNAAQEIKKELSASKIKDRRFLFSAVPYYITFVVYDDYGILYTNDPFLPVLPKTDEKAVLYYSKNYFTDGDLNILYYAELFNWNDRVVMVQTVLNMDTDTTELLQQGIPKTVMLAIIPELIVSFLISLFMTRSTMRPVVKMTQAAQQISISNLDKELPVKHTSGKQNELDILALTFNGLFAKLKSDFDRERSFTSDVSHELKTPVAVILGQSNLLRRWGKNDPAQLEKSLEVIISEAHSMESIIMNLLQLSRLENKKLVPKKENIEIQQLFLRIQEEVLSVSSNAKVEFDVKGKGNLFTDAELLHQVCMVVISNSIKFASDKVFIHLSFTEKDGTKILSIQDDGPGFAPDILPHVFERFYRGDASHSKNSGGSGLGLSIAKAIVTSLKGKITASNAQTGGALIEIFLNDD